MNLEAHPQAVFSHYQVVKSSEGGSGMSIIPPVGGTRVLKFEDTLSQKDCRNFKLIYESLLLEGRAGNLTNLTLEMILAEKPPTWLPVMYERLKHLIINADTFREKMRIGHYPRIGGKGKKSSKRIGKPPRGIQVMKDGRHNDGKGNRHTRTPGSNLRSYPAIGNQNDLIWFVGFRCMCWFLFCVPLEVDYMD